MNRCRASQPVGINRCGLCDAVQMTVRPRASEPTTPSEVERVRAVYAGRVDTNRYSPLRADQVAIAAARARVWGHLLMLGSLDLGVVLEIGCGEGAALRWANDAGAQVAAGVDVIYDRLTTASRLNPRTPLVMSSGSNLPMRSGSIDTVVCSTLFSSILSDDVAMSVSGEIRRVLKSSGQVLWFDFRRDNPLNKHVRPVPVGYIRRLFPDCEIDVRTVVLAPPLASRLLRWPRVAAFLEAMPALRTHLAGVVRMR